VEGGQTTRIDVSYRASVRFSSSTLTFNDCRYVKGPCYRKCLEVKERGRCVMRTTCH